MPTVIINGRKHTPGSNTLKKLKRKAAMEAEAKKSSSAPAPKKASKKKKADKKAPIPRPRDERPNKKAPVNVVLPDRGFKNPKDRVDTGQKKAKSGDGGKKKGGLKNKGRPVGFSTKKYKGPFKK